MEGKCQERGRKDGLKRKDGKEEKNGRRRCVRRRKGRWRGCSLYLHLGWWLRRFVYVVQRDAGCRTDGANVMIATIRSNTWLKTVCNVLYAREFGILTQSVGGYLICTDSSANVQVTSCAVVAHCSIVWCRLRIVLLDTKGGVRNVSWSYTEDDCRVDATR